MRYFVIILSLLLLTPVHAQDNTQAVTIVAKSDKAKALTVDEVLLIAQGLSQLDCGNKAVKDGTKESVICEPYKWPMAMVWQIATAQRQAREVVTEFNRLRDVEVSKLPRKADGTISDEAQAQFAVKMRSLLDAAARTHIDKFKRSELEPMSLPPSVISLLLPIIE